ncbi:MAG TPA: hypothetical protein ENK57_24390 [Polyangiaceae bacterium]|nr:hypothetical protein [Polyangiaceae bacterium]
MIEAAVDKIVDGLAPLLPGLLDLQARAEALGVFLADRELLQCPDCGLMEDVTAHGILITYRGEPPGEDTGLRFKPLVAEDRFRCPSCSAEVEAPPDADDDLDEMASTDGRGEKVVRVDAAARFGQQR